MKPEKMQIDGEYTITFNDGNQTRGTCKGPTKIRTQGKALGRVDAIRILIDGAPATIMVDDIEEVFEGDCTDCGKEKGNDGNTTKSGKPVRGVRKASKQNDS